MTVELYISWNRALEELVTLLSQAFAALPEAASTGIRSEHRFGLNYGGDYYVYELMGLTMRLLKNSGETSIPEKSNYPYYLLTTGPEARMPRAAADRLASHLGAAGVDVAVDSLAW